MSRRYTLLTLALILFSAAAALAQSSEEFGRASGGQLDLAVKGPTQFSGSLGLSLSPRSNGLRGYGGTFGGTVVRDRLWFFATADRSEMRLPSTVATIPRFSSNVLADLGDRNSLGASFRTQKTIPSSFLSLRYTGIVSSNSFMTATVSKSSSH